MTFVENLNEKFADSAAGRFFRIKERRTTFTQEMRGGLVTFLTIAYILPVNAGILGDTGGPCVTNGACPLGPGSLGDDACQSCLTTLKKNLISATAASCVISHFLMGAVGNLPLAVAPGMGLNAFFAYTVVGFMGTGQTGVTYEQALTAVFIEGFIFVAISLLGIRTKFIELIPRSILLATSAGIGLFLAFIGLQQGEGIGLVTYNSATLVTLGGCAPADRSRQFTFVAPEVAPGVNKPNVSDVCVLGKTGDIELSNAWVASGTYSCSSGGVLRSATLWLGISGGMLMATLMAKNVKGSMLIGIVFVTVISWIAVPGNNAAYIGMYSPLPGAQMRYETFRKVVSLPDTSLIAGKFDWSGFSNGSLWLALITFLYVDFLDATGTLFSMANFLSQYIPNFVNLETKRFDRQLYAYCVDGVSIIFGACLGTSPLTVYIESASGIREGARTGLSMLWVMLCFIVALFFSPLIANIPPYATGPALVLVGSMMMLNIVKVNWASVQDAVPAFLTVAVMPLTYSISYGLIAGIMSYLIINIGVLIWNFIHVSFFPGSFPQESKDAGNGNNFQAAWHLTANPPRAFGLLDEVVPLPTDTDATLRAMTFRLHTENAVTEETESAAKDVEASK